MSLTEHSCNMLFDVLFVVLEFHGSRSGILIFYFVFHINNVRVVCVLL